MPKITVILPVYNVAPYLPRCVDSLLCQTHGDLEIFLVDDGSTDGSGAVCDGYARRDPRVRAIHKANGGAASARNAALDRMTGDYVTFVDPDDYVAPEYCQYLLEDLLAQGADIAKCFQVQFTEGSSPAADLENGTLQVYSGGPELLFRVRGMESVIMKLFRRELFDGLRFPDFRVAQDSALMMELLGQRPKIVYDSRRFYFYQLRGTGATLAVSRRQLDRIPAFAHWVSIAEARHGDDFFILYCTALRFLEEGIGAVTRTYSLLTPEERAHYKRGIYGEYRRLSRRVDLPRSLKFRMELFRCCTPAYLLMKKVRSLFVRETPA